MPFYFNIFNPPQEEQAVQPPAVTDTLTQADTVTPDTSEQTVAPLDEPAPVEPTTQRTTVDADTIVVETDDYWLTLSTQGGGTFTSILLKNYPGPHGEPFAELIPERKSHVFAMRAVDFQGDTIDFGMKPFEISGVSSVGDTLHVESPTPLSFVHTTPEGGVLTRTLTFYPEDYHIGLSVQLDHFRDVISNRRYHLVWNSAIAITESNAQDDLTYSKSYGLLADELVDIDAGKASVGDPEIESIEGRTRWVAVRNKYFTSIITPVNKEAIGIRLVGTKAPTDSIDIKNYNASIVMPYSENVSQKDSFFVYIGPLDYDELRSYGQDFQRMMNFGWKIIRPISKAVLWAFTSIHQYIPNYGLVLILFGIVVKILVFPLTKKSYVSMKSMQNLQPKVQELRDKYKDDQQKMNQEMMKIYKEHGVNPMGGCLPMLLQMPLLYALFIVFRSTIELRGAEFIGWITDLSQPDTVFTLPFSLPLYGANVNILPIVMGVTMIIQQRMTSSATSQQQKMMMWFMPVIFLLIFNNFPSGLNLYYALFNLMTIIQQKWFIDIPGQETSSVKKK
jgi:YidC/Oxa1 family membrane protein insertase